MTRADWENPHSLETFNDTYYSEAFNDTFVAKIKEVVDTYQPDMLWFDSRMNRVSEDALKGKQIKAISLLGSAETVTYSQDKGGVSIHPSQETPSEHALAFKLEFA